MSGIVKVENLSIAYQAGEIFSKLSFEIKKGDYIGLAGPNGSGKTSLLKALLGLLRFKEGKIELFGEDIKNFSQFQKIAYLPQLTNQHNLFPAKLSEVVLSGLAGLSKEKRKAHALNLNKILKDLSLESLAHKSFASLSGGQKQKALLARALIREAELLILDEPSTALDPIARSQFYSILEQENKEKGTSIIMVSHDTAEIGRYAKTLFYLNQELVFFGPFSEFCKSSKMREYFGDFSQHIICHQHD